MSIAITGGTGFVGQAVLDEAGRRGLAVRALARREQAPRAHVEWVRGDLADRQALARLVAGAEGVIHIAGVINAPDEAAFRAGNVIVRGEPDWTLLPADLPASLRAVLQKCLEKDRKRRLGDIAVAQYQIQEFGVTRA